MKLTLGELFASPDFHFFALEAERALFLRMDRDAYHRSIFLDARIRPLDKAPLAVPVEPLLRSSSERVPPPLGWIFHVAQCGSTLLARALDRPDGSLILREPTPFRQLGVAAAIGERQSPAWSARLRLATAMAARRYVPERMTIVKATVPVNFVLANIARSDPSAPAIFLYLGFEAYLCAVLRSAGHRAWVRRLTDEMAWALPIAAEALAVLGDSERAALLWAAQIERFDMAMSLLPHSHSLDAELLFAEPRAIVDAACRMFGAMIPESQLSRIVDGELFATYSKNPDIPFDNRARLDRQGEVARSLAAEIETARRWMVAQSIIERVPPSLARPLHGGARPLVSA